MHKLTVTAAVVAFAASLASFVVFSGNPVSPGAALGSISPHDLTLSAPAMEAGIAADAF